MNAFQLQVFDPTAESVPTLTSDHILISDGGKLSLGETASNCRYDGRAEIVLTGVVRIYAY